MNRTPASAAALTALVLAGCAAVVPEVERWSPPPIGATWESAQRNSGSFGRDAQVQITRVDTTWQGKPAIGFRSSSGMTTVVHPRSGRWIAIVAPDGKPVISFDPPIGWDHPVAVGKQWKHRQKVTFANGQSVEYDYSCKAEAYEKVTVRAGTFDTFRIACQSSVGNNDVFWMAPANGLFVKSRQERLAGAPSGAGTQEVELVSYRAPR